MPKKKPPTGSPVNGAESDEALFRRFTGGDDRAFETIVLRYKDRAFWVAHHMLKDSDESLDLAQEAFARAYTAAASFDPKQKFSTWFFRILVNLCIDTLRKRRTRKTLVMGEPPEAVSDAPGPGDHVQSRETREMVREILQILPSNHRAILVLRDLQGLSCLEIAEILRCTHATARWRLHRARARFREAWEERFGSWT